ncbi:hypothetical protein LXL04_009304 [Taraxacum kok-saghyz]
MENWTKSLLWAMIRQIQLIKVMKINRMKNRTMIEIENVGTNMDRTGERICATYFILPQINFLSPERCRPPNMWVGYIVAYIYEQANWVSPPTLSNCH